MWTELNWQIYSEHCVSNGSVHSELNGLRELAYFWPLCAHLTSVTKPEVRNLRKFTNPPAKDRATAMGNMHIKFGEAWTCDSRDRHKKGKRWMSAIHHEERRRGAHLPFFGHEPVGGWITIVCDAWPVRGARPTVTFPAAEHHRPLTGTKLYCLVTVTHVCEQLARDLLSRKSNALTITPPGHTGIGLSLRTNNKLVKQSKTTKYISSETASPLREVSRHGITWCYLPPGRGDIASFTTAKLVFDLATPKGCKAELI